MRPRKYDYVKLGESQYYVDNIDGVISDVEKYIEANGNYIACNTWRRYTDVIASVLNVSKKTYHNWERYGVIDIMQTYECGGSKGVFCRFNAVMLLDMLRSHRDKQKNGIITKRKKPTNLHYNI